MDDIGTPLPEERGDLEPPKRWPPTAIGVATPPPPPRHVRSRGRRRLLLPVYLVAAGLSLGGLMAWLLGPWLLLRAAGVGSLVAGLLSLGVVSWVTSGAAARVALWRRTRWLRRRQRELTRTPRPSA